MNAATHSYSGQYALAAPAPIVDPRVTPVRGDLADIALAGKVFVPHYAVPMKLAVAEPFVALRKAGRDDAEQASELLRGERFMVLDIAGKWAWGYGEHDGYLGYLPAAALAEPEAVPPPRQAPAAADPAQAAESLAGTRYHWGGRGGDGIDCSGLVQRVFAQAGHAMPRDSDQQAVTAGRPLAEDEEPRRGDLVFFPGHVGILKDPATLIHASQQRGCVLAEPLVEVIAGKGPVTAARRVE